MTDINDSLEIEDGVINGSDQSYGLVDFLGIDTSEVEANEGGFTTPSGLYKGVVEKVSVKPVERTLDNGDKVSVPNVTLYFKVDEVISAKDEAAAERMIGKTKCKFYTLPIKNMEKLTAVLGRLKAIAKRCNNSEDNLVDLKAILEAIVNKPISFKIAERSYKNRNDETVVTSNVDIKTIKPAD